MLMDEGTMINLIIADDHTVLREALCEMLKKQGGYNVLASVGDGEELIATLKDHTPDLIILDISMPKLDGLGALEKMKQMERIPRVLILSANEGRHHIKGAMKAGAKGYVPKNVEMHELEAAINTVLNGRTYISPALTPALVGESESDPLTVLTRREIEVLKYLADGMPNRDIGKLLHISTRTVDTHRTNILKKLKVKTNAELVKLAIGCELIKV